MEFLITNVIGDFRYTKTINTIEDLKELYVLYGHELIVDFENRVIRIYDNYIE